jgi:hypothetical protein
VDACGADSPAFHRVGKMPRVETPAHADLLITGAELVATVDDARREIPGGWVAVAGGAVSALDGPADPGPRPSAPSTPAVAWSPRGWSTPITTCTRT